MPEDPKKPVDKMPEDPPEVWEQKGDATPGAEPPAGVRSDDVPDPIPHPNFVLADPLPLMQHEPLPEDEAERKKREEEEAKRNPTVQPTPEPAPDATIDYTPDEPSGRRGRHS